MTKKVLWVVDGSRDRLLDRATYIGASAVAVRTTNNWLKAAMPAFKAKNIDVLAWRWPGVRPANTAGHYFALEEAQFVVEELIPAGLSGYIVDAESDGPDHPGDDWDHANLDTLAANFCDTIKTAGRKKTPNFLFGITSGRKYPTSFPNIPWKTFVQCADAVYPQFYWYGDSGPEGGGTPQSAFDSGMKSWKTLNFGAMRIVPIIGQIAHVKATEISSYSAILNANKFDEVHFYSDTTAVPQANYDAMKSL